jgi:Ca-activated chloride channel homolog
VELLELYPGELPDLFAGEELVLFGRYRGQGDGELRIRGRRAGRSETFGAEAGFAGRTVANDFIPRLWASRKLGELTRQVRLNGADPELVEAIRTTALRYGLLSEYTAYLVQEPTAVAGGLQPVTLQQAMGVPADAAAPKISGQGASGEGAVRASERARAQRAVASSADLARAEAEVMERVAASGPGAELRVAAGRTFRRDEGVWTELAPDDADRPVTAVALYSAAFFELLDALPELRAVVEALEPVVVHGREVSIRFEDRGATTLSARELAGLVERFRRR